MPQHGDARIRARQIKAEGAGAVGRAVVDKDQLELHLLKGGGDPADKIGNRPFLVPHRHDDGKLWTTRGCHKDGLMLNHL